ncbi:HAD family hydrolase [Zobellella sp. An-6]|uniref:HAD family hydrolase n=1 Tax=Zobellella sp. An-6 TaxID=3400218 RepID=UPI00404198A0
MILILDLDDTLYPERTFVESGFQAVAQWLQSRFSWNANDSLIRMRATLAASGRGVVFDELLSHHGKLRRSLVKDCLKVYRHHKPQIMLAPEARKFIDDWGERLYLVTDGHKVVQHNKIVALGLEHRFTHAYITHRYGINRAKPSPYCFERILTLESCDWRDLIYVGDNPDKDFVTLNKKGSITIRVMTGEHRDVIAKPGHDARYSITNLGELMPLLMKLQFDFKNKKWSKN